MDECKGPKEFSLLSFFRGADLEFLLLPLPFGLFNALTSQTFFSDPLLLVQPGCFDRIIHFVDLLSPVRLVSERIKESRPSDIPQTRQRSWFRESIE